MLLASWNVNGLRAASKKGFLGWLARADPDVLLVQETKARAEDLPKKLREVPGYDARFAAAKKKGYAGVAVYTRYEPDDWFDGLGDEAFDAEGRVVGARFADLVVVSAYFPNSQEGGARLDYKLAFCAALERFLRAQLDRGRHVLVGGDYNIAHEEIDIARPKQNANSPGFLPDERAWMSRFLEAGFKDSWREQNPSVAGRYTWWSFRSGARDRNVGWRLDYFCCDGGLWPSVRDTGILDGVTGSDHCPVTIDVENPK